MHGKGKKEQLNFIAYFLQTTTFFSQSYGIWEIISIFKKILRNKFDLTKKFARNKSWQIHI